jgi:hypothetical protein
MLRLFDDLGILMINEEKNILQKFLFRRNRMEWLSHIAYSGMELCMPILLGDVSKKNWMQIIFEKFQNSQWTHPLTKLNINKSCYVDSNWLW